MCETRLILYNTNSIFCTWKEKEEEEEGVVLYFVKQ